MHVISPRRLKEFWAVHPDAEKPLRAWFRSAKKGWGNFVQVRQEYPSADYVLPYYTIFNIGHNKYRLVAIIEYRLQKVFVHRVFTHAAYDRWNKE